MPDADKIAAYDELRRRADELGFACVGEALDALEVDQASDAESPA